MIVQFVIQYNPWGGCYTSELTYVLNTSTLCVLVADMKPKFLITEVWICDWMRPSVKTAKPGSRTPTSSPSFMNLTTIDILEIQRSAWLLASVVDSRTHVMHTSKEKSYGIELDVTCYNLAKQVRNKPQPCIACVWCYWKSAESFTTRPIVYQLMQITADEMLLCPTRWPEAWFIRISSTLYLYNADLYIKGVQKQWGRTTDRAESMEVQDLNESSHVMDLGGPLWVTGELSVPRELA